MVGNRVPSRYLNYLLDILDDAGHTSCRYLASHQLDQCNLEDSRGYISFDQYIDVIEDILRSSQIQGLGLRYGLRIHPADHGILGYAFLSSANLSQGLKIFSTYQRILGPIVDVFIDVEADQACYTAVRAGAIEPAVYHFGVEAWLAEATHFLPFYKEGRFKFSSARVVYPEPTYAKRYAELLGCEVQFEQPVNELRFPAKILDIPFSMAEESVAELCASQCEHVMRQMAAHDDTVNQVRRLLLRQPGTITCLQDVANRLCISGRTLRRRLQASGSTYRDIATEVRMTLGAEYLRNTALSISEIAFLLGYSDVTAFHRSFKKNYGRTPARYREAALLG